MSIGLKKSMRAWHRWLGLFTSIQLLLWTVSGLFFTVPDITDVRGEQYRLIKDSLEMEAKPKNLAPIQSIIKKDSDFLEEEFKIILRKTAQSWGLSSAIKQSKDENLQCIQWPAIGFNQSVRSNLGCR